MTLAFLALAIVNHRQLRHINRRALISGLIVGLFLAAGYQFQTAGLARTTAAKSAFITGLVVVFVPLFTIVPALRSANTPPPRWTTAIGALLAFSGLLLLTTPAGTSPQNLFVSIGPGDLLTLACAIAFAGHLLALAHTSHRVPTGQLATLQIGVAALIMAITLPSGGKPHLSRHSTPRRRSRRYQPPSHRRRVHHPKLVSATPSTHPHRYPPHSRTSLRLPDLLPRTARTSWQPLPPGSSTHPSRNRHHRATFRNRSTPHPPCIKFQKTFALSSRLNYLRSRFCSGRNTRREQRLYLRFMPCTQSGASQRTTNEVKTY